MNSDEVASKALDWLAAASWQLALFILIVAAATWLLRKASPRLRHGLWLLVLVKALLPPTLGGPLLAAPWAVGQWAVAPVEKRLPPPARQLATLETIEETRSAPANDFVEPEANDAMPERASEEQPRNALTKIPLSTLLFGAWSVGVIVVLGCVGFGYAALRKEVSALAAIDEGPVRVALERAALAVGLADADAIDLRVTDRPCGTFLLGVRRPTIVLPRAAAEELEPEELVGVLTHEVVHWLRRDTLVGWVQAVVHSLFWFHPLVWWAGARLRDERERCCDDAVLRSSVSDRESYGEAIVRSLTIGRGRPIGLSASSPLAAAGLVGVFERGAQLQQRVEDVMDFQPNRGQFGWRSVATLAVFAAVFLPMAGAKLFAQDDVEIVALSLDDAADSATRIETDTEIKIEGTASTRITTKWATTVCLAEVKRPDVENAQLIYAAQVKSDLDQSASLEMWAHLDGRTYFSRNPQVAVFGKSDWKRLEIPFLFKAGQRPDKVTLNVIINGPGTVWVDDLRLLKRPLPGGFVGSAAAERPKQPVKKTVTAAKPIAASPYPALVKTVPEIGATEVDPSLDEIRVTFDRDMITSDYSFVGSPKNPEFPADMSQNPRWIDDRTCVLPVKLKKGSFYRVGINSKDFQNFKGIDGKPAEHRVLSFATAGAKRSVQRKAKVPQIVELSPGNGDGEVDPTIKKISVTFDTKMGGGASWVTLDRQAWPGAAGGRPEWSKDGRTCTLPVEIEPGKTYKVGLNGPFYLNFQSRYGVPLPAVVWSFTTAE